MLSKPTSIAIFGVRNFFQKIDPIPNNIALLNCFSKKGRTLNNLGSNCGRGIWLIQLTPTFRLRFPNLVSHTAIRAFKPKLSQFIIEPHNILQLSVPFFREYSQEEHIFGSAVEITIFLWGRIFLSAWELNTWEIVTYLWNCDILVNLWHTCEFVTYLWNWTYLWICDLVKFTLLNCDILLKLDILVKLTLWNCNILVKLWYNLWNWKWWEMKNFCSDCDSL